MRLYEHNYSYDALGNILEDGWKSYEYDTQNNNYLLGHDNNTNQYTYDAHGNLTQAPNLDEIVWNCHDRMLSVNSYSDIYSYYSYDLQGERTRKVVVKNNIIEEYYYFCGYELYRKINNNNVEDERKTISIFDMKMTVEEIPDEKSNKTKKMMRYEIDPYRTIARLETATITDSNPVSNPDTVIRYQYDNHLGSACLELNENAEIISYEEYYPFGSSSYCAMNDSIEVSMKRYRFCGKERDEETGLYYFGARFYAPWMCRFCSCDELQFSHLELNPYNFCANNPLRFIDPDGMDFEPVVDKENKTITITAVYYTTDDNKERLQTALNAWNDQSGKYSLSTGEGDKPETYIINFNLTIAEGEHPTAEEVGRDFSRDGKSNLFQVTELPIPTERGRTEDGFNIRIDAKRGLPRTDIHEIGHTLGIGEGSNGVMAQGEKSDRVTKTHVATILERSGMKTFGNFSGSMVQSQEAKPLRTHNMLGNFIRTKKN